MGQIMKTMLWMGSALAVVLAAAPAAAQDAEPTAVSEVVVTGEKAGRTVQETTASVAVVTAEQIGDEGLTDLYDVYDQVPNVNARFGDAGFVIRGIDAFNVSTGGNAGLASLYLDEVALPRRAIEAGPLQAWDVGQVEVLRGPQSTLQGRNALAGAIYVNSQAPTFDWSARARAIFREGARREYAFAGGGPLIDDQFAVRVSVEDVTADGFVKNPTRGGDAFGEDARNYRVGFLATPAALPKLHLQLTYLDSTRSQGEERSVIDAPDFWDHRTNPSNDPGRIDIHTGLVSARAGWDASDALKLSSVTGWVRSHYLATADNDLTAQPESFLTFDRLEETYSQELRANFDLGRVKGVVGLYGAYTDVEDYSTSRVAISPQAVGLFQLLTSPPYNLPAGTANAIIGLYPATVPVDSTQDNPFSVHNYAAFTDFTVSLTDRWELLGGLRLDREELERAATNTAALGGALPNPLAFTGLTRTVVGAINSYINGQIAAANGAQAATKSSFDAALPKLGLRYRFNDDMSAAFVVQRGYRSGGSSTNYARAQVVEYDPEYTWNYEASFRSVWRGGRLMFNANAFYTDWKDQQVPVQLSGNIYDTQTANAGESHLYGVELEMRHRVSEALSYYASAGAVRTKFDRFVFNGADLSGAEFANAPRYSAAMGITWRNPQGLFVDVNANYRSGAYDNISPSGGQTVRPIDARTLVNLKTGYETARYGLYLTAQNLFDEHYILAGDGGDGYWAYLGQPRTLGVQLEAKW